MKLSIGLISLFTVIKGLEHPNFQELDSSLLDKTSFFEQFQYNNLSESPWISSKAKKDGEFLYNGEWGIESSVKYPGYDNDKGLVMKKPASRYGIYHKLDKVFNNVDNDLVLQYEVKFQNGVTCGGAYIKLLDENFANNGEFDNDVPFHIMFGPDKCGANDKVHFIINKLNPVTGKFEEKHLSHPPISRNTPLSTLYTLIFKKNSDFEIRINGDVAIAGNLLMEPHLLEPRLDPPKEIVDQLDRKPDDWEELEFIADESVTKPLDYDEKFVNAYMPDPKVIKPEGWLDDEAEFIYEPFAKKPDQWDDEEDGDWEPPIIDNPKCVIGCGKWEAPLVPNIHYKGPWIQPVIKNPRYKGEWKPKMIPNPNYYEEKHPANLKVGGLGFDLWTIENDVLFDNIYLGHSIKEAEFIGNKTFSPKFELEIKDYEVNKPKPIKGPSPPPKSFEEIWYEEETSTFTQIYLFFHLVFKREFLNMKDWWFEFNTNPIPTLMDDPLKALVYSGVFIFAFTFFFAIVNVIVFLLSSWAKDTKEAINNASQKLDIDSAQQVPKIEEIADDKHELTSPSEDSSNIIRKRK